MFIVHVCTATCHRPKTMVWSLAQCSVLDTTLSLAWGISDLHIVHTHTYELLPENLKVFFEHLTSAGTYQQ